MTFLKKIGMVFLTVLALNTLNGCSYISTPGGAQTSSDPTLSEKESRESSDVSSWQETKAQEEPHLPEKVQEVKDAETFEKARTEYAPKELAPDEILECENHWFRYRSIQGGAGMSQIYYAYELSYDNGTTWKSDENAEIYQDGLSFVHVVAGNVRWYGAQDGTILIFSCSDITPTATCLLSTDGGLHWSQPGWNTRISTQIESEQCPAGVLCWNQNEKVIFWTVVKEDAIQILVYQLNAQLELGEKLFDFSLPQYPAGLVYHQGILQYRF